jgi:hypothetical protein
MHRRLALAVSALALSLAAPAAALAQGADIEGVWSYNGGQVVVRSQPGGPFLGTVIRVTQLAECPHPVGEHMWTNVVPQPDGQYFGEHQWFNTSTCQPLPTKGRTAWRVLAKPDGTKLLRACFSKPETPELQPSIAPDGTFTNVNQRCHDSDLIAPLPTGRPQIGQIVTLPSQGRRRCMSRRAFRIRLKEPPGDALETASVFVNNRRVETRTGARITAPIDLRGLPRGRYTVKITARTILGQSISGTRRYRTCARRSARSNRSPV